MAKLTLFLLYLRLFSVDRLTKYLVYFGMTIITPFYLGAMLVAIINCSPRTGETRFQGLDSNRCGRQRYMGFVQTVFNLISDFYLLIIPVNVVRKLQMPTRKKIEVLSLFMFGILGCMCAVINSYYRIELVRSKDRMWDAVPVIITSTFEINVGIMVACMPYLAPMMRSGTSKLARTYSNLRTRLAVHNPLGKNVSRGAIFDEGKPDESTTGAAEIPRAYLETRMLNGVDGKGKFLQSGTVQQKSWWQRGMLGSHSGGGNTTTCNSEA
ncbi:MAG: hypothetical protein Q9193_001248 [Seirophora villosa]